MKKYIISILASFAALLGASTLTSCQDELDVTPDGRMTMSDVFASQENIRNYFASAWSHIPMKLMRYYFFDNFLIDMSDDGWSVDEYQPLLINELYAGNCTTTKHRFEWDDTGMGKWDGGYWRRYWQMVRIINNCIKNFPTANFDNEDDRDLFTAEAHVLRAYYYLLLVKFYGDLPIITEPMDINSPFGELKRAEAWEVFQFIVDDCEIALESKNLPWTLTSIQLQNRMTKGIACAIMSQASLFAASPLFCHGKDLWDYAYEKNKKAYDLLTANGYELYNHLNDSKAYKCPYEEYFASRSYAGSKADDHETIWGSSIQEAGNTNLSMINGIPLFGNTFKCGVCPTQELVDCYDMLETGEPIYDLTNPYVDEMHSDININPKSGYDPANPYKGRDPRFAANIWYNGSKINTGILDKSVDTWNNESTWNGEECKYSASAKSGTSRISIKDRLYTRTGYYNRKYHAYKVQPNQTKDEGNWKYFRLGEVILNYAEACAETGRIAEAMKFVNDIRHRAGFDPKVDKVASSVDEARLIVHHERHCELAFEEHRYFDVRRWGTYNEEIKEEKYNTGMWIHKDGTKFVYVRFPLGRDQGAGPSKYCSAAKFRLVPIPQSDANNLGAHTGLGSDYWQNPGWE